MLYILLGLIAGTLAALSHLSWIAVPLDAAVTALSAVGQHGANQLSTWLGHRNSALGSAVGVVLGVAAPGLVCMALIGAARFGVGVRRGLSGLFVLVAIAGFFFLALGEAVALAVLCGIVAVLFATVTGFLVVAPLAAMAAAMAVTCGRQLLTGGTSAVGRAAVQMGTLTHTDAPTLWKVALLVVAWAGFVGAGFMSLRGKDSSSSSAE